MKKLLFVILLVTAYSCTKKEKAVLPKYEYIDKAVKYLGINKTGIVVTRDTNVLAHPLPNTVCFNSEGVMVPSESCYNSTDGFVKSLTKANTPAFIGAPSLKEYLAAERFKKLDGTVLTLEDLPKSEFFYFYEWSAVLAFDATSLQNMENYIVQNGGEKKIYFIKVNAYDAKELFFGQKQ